MDKRIGPWHETSDGGRIYFLDPRPGDYNIKAVAHAQANICRFTGHCKRFYSVALHSVWVAREVAHMRSPCLQLAALLHDVSETDVNDLSGSIKDYLHDYQRVEQILNATMYMQFLGFVPDSISKCLIKLADKRVLLAEAKALMPFKPENWEGSPCMSAGPVKRWHAYRFFIHWRSERAFLKMYYRLVKQIQKEKSHA